MRESAMSEKRQISSMFKLNNDEIEALKTKYINDKKNEGTDVDHKNSAISAINDQQHLKPEQKSESISLYHQYESTESIPQTHLLTYDSGNDFQRHIFIMQIFICHFKKIIILEDILKYKI